jgi:hypothetical protein
VSGEKFSISEYAIKRPFENAARGLSGRLGARELKSNAPKMQGFLRGLGPKKPPRMRLRVAKRGKARDPSYVRIDGLENIRCHSTKVRVAFNEGELTAEKMSFISSSGIAYDHR